MKIVGMLATLVLLTAACSSGATNGGSPASSSANSPTVVPVNGIVEIPGEETTTNDGPGTECWAYGNDPLSKQIGTDGPPSVYNDVKQGAQVVITNASGKVVGTAQLGAGVANSQSDGATGGNKRYPCDFTFSSPGIISGQDFYGVKVGAHSEQVSGDTIKHPTVKFTS